MIPQIQYVTTADGVRIAYAVHGRGPAILSMPPLPFRHVELEWKLAGDARWLERLGRNHTVIRYDPRGLGLSERDVSSYDAEALQLDIDAVLERTATGPVALFAAVTSGTLGLSYAAHHPERVSHVILWCSAARTLEAVGPRLEALFALLDRDWELFTETMAHVVRGWSAGEDARRFAAVLRACASPQAIRALLIEARSRDTSALLSKVRCPVLVVHRRELTWIPLERAVELAASIHDARLVILEGGSMAPWAGDMEAAARTIEEFLGTAPAAPADSQAGPDSEMLQREGEYWTLAFAGSVARVRDAKGLHHLAYLLRHPGESVPAMDLVRSLEPATATPGARDQASLSTVADLGDAGALLDARAKRAYRDRISELRADLAEAERFNDPGRAAAARVEIEVLSEQLAAAVGLGGRDRKAGSAAERARLTVTKRIRDALGRIERAHPELGAYLTRTIRTGLLCAYLPDADRPAG